MTQELVKNNLALFLELKMDKKIKESKMVAPNSKRRK